MRRYCMTCSADVRRSDQVLLSRRELRVRTHEHHGRAIVGTQAQDDAPARQDTQLGPHRRGHAQPRARLRHQSPFGESYSAAGCIRTLTRISRRDTKRLCSHADHCICRGDQAAYLHWQWAFALLAAAGIAAWLYNRSRLAETLPQGVVPVRITLQTFRRILANRSAFSIIVLGFSQFFGYYVFLVFLPKLLTALFSQSALSEGFFFVPLTAGILAGISLGGRWQKHWGRARIVGASSFGIGLNVLLFWLALSAIRTKFTRYVCYRTEVPQLEPHTATECVYPHHQVNSSRICLPTIVS